MREILWVRNIRVFRTWWRRKSQLWCLLTTMSCWSQQWIWVHKNSSLHEDQQTKFRKSLLQSTEFLQKVWKVQIHSIQAMEFIRCLQDQQCLNLTPLTNLHPKLMNLRKILKSIIQITLTNEFRFINENQ